MRAVGLLHRIGQDGDAAVPEPAEVTHHETRGGVEVQVHGAEPHRIVGHADEDGGLAHVAQYRQPGILDPDVHHHEGVDERVSRELVVTAAHDEDVVPARLRRVHGRPTNRMKTSVSSSVVVCENEASMPMMMLVRPSASARPVGDGRYPSRETLVSTFCTVASGSRLLPDKT